MRPSAVKCTANRKSGSTCSWGVTGSRFRRMRASDTRRVCTRSRYGRRPLHHLLENRVGHEVILEAFEQNRKNV